MKTQLRCLIVEDSADDCWLLLRELAAGGYGVEHVRVQSAATLAPELVDGKWDLIISDYTMPGFGAGAALEMVKRSGLDVPFIIVSGTIGEETAVAALKAGAHDFLLKHQLARLIPAIERELREAASRRDKGRAELALRNSEHRYRQIVETAQEGIWIFEADGRTRFTNRRMAQMLGAEPEALLGASFFDFLVDPRWELTTESRTTRFKRRDGTEFWASLSTNPISDPASPGLGALAMVTDITEQKKLQEQLMISDRMASVGTLAAGVAHEINNPLAAVMGNLELCEQFIGDLRAQQPSLQVLNELSASVRDGLEAASRVRDVVRDLKVFSRGEEDRRVPVDVINILETTLRMAANEIRHRATVVKEFRPIPLVDANASRLGQVFLNLVVNAAHAIEEGRPELREIRLSTFVDGRGRVVVECHDTGAGISPEVLRRLFTPFFTTKAPGVGTGLGLSISQRIVSSLGGEISVESTVGKGSVFRVSLPPCSRVPEPTSNPPPKEASKRRARILVVDDEPMLLTVLSKALSPHHEVLVAPAAAEALAQIVSGSRFDLILCDLMMPEMTGMELYAAILAADPAQAARMVFLTGGAFTASANAFLDAVPNPRVSKPFNIAELRTAIGQWLDAAPLRR